MASVIGWILRCGVVLSAACIAIGLALAAYSPQCTSKAVITVGLFLLIATPVIRVAASLIAFAVEGDAPFVLITAAVLAILLFSIFFAGKLLPLTPHAPLGEVHYTWAYLCFIFAGSILAGFIGSLIGLGGGVLIVPLVTLVFGFPIYDAIGASIIAVIATSSGAAAAYVKDRMVNMRVGMFLEIATTIGAVSGAFLVGYFSASLLSVIFGVILLISSLPMVFKFGEELPQGVQNDALATRLCLDGSYPDHKTGQIVSYQVTHTGFGLIMMYIAGLISGLLGIGSGTFKVLGLDVAMRLPMKVSTTTSNFMIGVTAAASAGIYYSRGDILPMLAAPIALGTLAGSTLGAYTLQHISNRAIRILFFCIILITAFEMIF
ncbi:MAG: DUF1634 domain-containing protein [Verrucomicrobia bacterium]|nr:DUF1634 domain-containing protein [Verrucomicrobiota bacterium]